MAVILNSSIPSSATLNLNHAKSLYKHKYYQASKYTKNSDLNYRIIFYKTKKYILSKSLL